MNTTPLRFLIPLLVLTLMTTACAEPADQADADYADQMEQEHQDDTTDPSGMVQPSTAALHTETVSYGVVDGSAVNGYLARPANADEPLPGVIVIHEWWGLNDNIKSMTEQLAAEGYTALAVDLYGGEVAQDAAGARALMSAAMQNQEAAQSNLTSAYAYLTSQENAARVASIGWCFGGGMSLNAALALPEDLDAAVIYYGRLSTDRDALAALTMPILGLFGEQDQGIPVDGVRAFEQMLKAMGKDVEIHIYEGAGHAFANPTGQNYQEAAAQDAWAKTEAFLEAHLKEAMAVTQ